LGDLLRTQDFLNVAPILTVPPLSSAADLEQIMEPTIVEAHFILFVADQEARTLFYSQALGVSPHLNVPGMTQFSLPGGTTLGLMPSAGIKRLLGAPLPDPQTAAGTPRSELYLLVEDPTAFLRRAVAAGAKELSPVEPRPWGDAAGYCARPTPLLGSKASSPRCSIEPHRFPASDG